LSGRQIAGIPTSTAGPRTPGQAKDSLTITGGLCQLTAERLNTRTDAAVVSTAQPASTSGPGLSC